MTKNDKAESPTPASPEKIVPTGIVSEMRTSYLDYAMSVIVSRALPDIRDGLKPVHRRILFSMHGLGLSHTAKFRKSALIIGDVLGKYHPHGDQAVYDAMSKLAQDFSTRYPLVTGQGNFGSMDGDPPAAYRYTEAKMARITDELIRDLEKETVDFVPNYDGRLKEPSVFPTMLPNLLLNGTLGIAVGMATKIPPHNLREVMGALIHLLDNPQASTDDLLEFVQGPDFPTGGIIFNRADIAHAYATGRGGVVVRGEAEIVETKAGAYQIVISSIPYQINKADFIMRMADLVHEKKLEGIRDIRDESNKEGVRVVVELKQATNPNIVLNALYKHTDLEQAFNYNMLALINGEPKTLSLKLMLEEFVAHRKEVIRRRTVYDLRKAEEREHILLGLKKALDFIDEVIKIIRKSKDGPEAHAALIARFKFSILQATAILEMKLQRLAGLERKKIEDELGDTQKLIEELKSILGSAKKIAAIIKAESVALSDKYGDERRTKVIKHGTKEIKTEDLIPNEEQVLVLTSGGYVKRTDPKEYRSQKRGGVGVIDLNIKEEDFITRFLTAETHASLLFFSDKGKAYQIKMYDLPEGKRATKGKSLMNYLSIESGERVTSLLAMPGDSKREKSLSLMLVTKAGVTKKVAAESFREVRRSGLLAIKLSNDDELIAARFVEKGDELIVATAKGQSIRFKESDIREMGRVAAGVRGMKLGKGDYIVGADVVSKGDDQSTFLVMTENGYGKMTALENYKTQKRGGSGIKTVKVTPKTGNLIVAQVVGDEEEIVAISKNGQVIRTKLSEIPSLGRQTQGVRIMKLREGDTIASLTCL